MAANYLVANGGVLSGGEWQGLLDYHIPGSVSGNLQTFQP